MRKRQQRREKLATIACGIDLGSNSFRLLVAELKAELGSSPDFMPFRVQTKLMPFGYDKAGLLRPLAQELVTVRLGEGLGVSGRLSPAAMARAEAALAGFAARIAAFSPVSLRACATHAVRRAGNRNEFLARVERKTGFKVEILSGEEEASLALAGVFSALPPEHRSYPFLLADVGGGSSEFIRLDSPQEQPGVVSMPIGAGGLSEKCGQDFAEIRRLVRTALAGTGNIFAQSSALTLVVSGGTATCLAALDLGLSSYEPELVQGHILTATKLAVLLDRLAALSPARREALPGLEHGRGRIILAGAVILQELQKVMADKPLLISDAGLLEGILFSGAARFIKDFPPVKTGH